MSGINGTGGAAYLTQIRQAATNLSGATGSGLIDTTKAQYASKTRSFSLDQVFSKVDSDGNGVVSKEEFERAQSQADGKIAAALSNLNTGSTASLVSLLQGTGQTNTVNKTGETGTSGRTDGTLTTEQVFGRIDTNGDGVITKGEFENVVSSMKSGGTEGSSATNPLTAQQRAEQSVASQTRALMQQAISQYKALAQTGQIAGTMGHYLLTG